MIQLSCQPNAPLSYPCPPNLWWPIEGGMKATVAELFAAVLGLHGFYRSMHDTRLYPVSSFEMALGAYLGDTSIENRKSARKIASICADSVLKDLFHTHGICARTDSIRERWARMETPNGRKEQVMAICGLTGPESFGGARTSNSTTTPSNDKMNLALSLLSERLKLCTQ